MFIRVLLPAPFSPSSASISPGFKSRSIWLFATTLGKRFVIPRACNAYAGSGASGKVEVCALTCMWLPLERKDEPQRRRDAEICYDSSCSESLVFAPHWLKRLLFVLISNSLYSML